MASYVWAHFQKTENGEKAVCMHCKMSLVYRAGNMSVMKGHLSAKHSILKQGTTCTYTTNLPKKNLNTKVY